MFYNFFFSHLKSFKVFLKKFADVILNVLYIFFDDFGLVHSDPVRIRGLRLIVQWNRYCTIFDTPKIFIILTTTQSGRDIANADGSIQV